MCYLMLWPCPYGSPGVANYYSIVIAKLSQYFDHLKRKKAKVTMVRPAVTYRTIRAGY